MDTKQQYIEHLYLTEERANNIELFGLVKQKPGGRVNGFFLIESNIERTTISVDKIVLFPQDLVLSIELDEQASKKEKNFGLSINFQFFKKMKRADGSSDILIEYKVEFFQPEAYWGMNNKFSTRDVHKYYKGDIIDIHVSPTGSYVYTKIPKRQITENKYFEGNFYMSYKDNLVVLYNDNIENLELKADKGAKIFVNPIVKGGFIMCTIHADGSFERKLLINYTEKNEKEDRQIINGDFYAIIDERRIAFTADEMNYKFTVSKEMLGILELR